MSDRIVTVVSLEIEEHPNADALEIARIGNGDYMALVLKGQFVSGDLAAYIPEQTIVPDCLIEEMGLVGRLSGPQKNRVKAIKLRGVLSQGLVYKARSHWKENDDVTEELGVIKYEPPIPASMRGQMRKPRGEHEKCLLKYDIENIKAHKDLFEQGEAVVITCKLHGTFMQISVLPKELRDKHSILVSSKGLGARGFSYDLDSEENNNNLYVRVAKVFNLEERLTDYYDKGNLNEPFIVAGEIFGTGVQDLTYGKSVAHDETIGFRVFDIYYGYRDSGRFLENKELIDVLSSIGLERVPVLFEGEFSKEKVKELSSGKETISGKSLHIREGVVIRPTIEKECLKLPMNRKQLKSISEEYLLRKNGMELE